MSFGAPIDPGYVSFEKGWESKDPFKKPVWRWHPPTAKFYHYPAPKWRLEDVGLEKVNTSTSLVPDIYRSLGESYQRIRSVNPRNPVWDPYTGKWESAVDTTRPAYPAGTSEGDDYDYDGTATGDEDDYPQV